MDSPFKIHPAMHLTHHKYVVCVWHFSSRSEQLFQVVKLKIKTKPSSKQVFFKLSIEKRITLLFFTLCILSKNRKQYMYFLCCKLHVLLSIINALQSHCLL